jgi:hypothetical protein
MHYRVNANHSDIVSRDYPTQHGNCTPDKFSDVSNPKYLQLPDTGIRQCWKDFSLDIDI